MIMTKEELAAQFAEQKNVELSELIKEAYLKGYEQGCLDSTGIFSVDGVKYVDLGLPSGTLWSKTPIEYCNYGYKQRLLSYHEALKLEIPTVEQWEEVCQFCRFEQEKIIGPSGNRIGYSWAPARYRIYNLGEGCEENRQMFWLKGDIDSENNAPTFIYDIKQEDDTEWIFSNVKGSSRHFIGYKLPVFLVKKRE